MKNAVNHLSTLFAAPPCTSSEGPCTPIRRPQTPCLDLPGGKDITMEDPTKESCHLRPSSVALCQDFSLKWALSAHRWGRSNAAKQCKNGCGMTQESATQWNHAPQTCYPHPLERTQRLGPRGMAITASRYNVLEKSTKIKGKNTKGQYLPVRHDLADNSFREVGSRRWTVRIISGPAFCTRTFRSSPVKKRSSK